MSKASRRMAGILLIIFPTVIYGGVSLLSLLVNRQSGYSDNELRQDLWRAGHAHAGVLLILALVVLRYVDETNLPSPFKAAVRYATPGSAILVPAAFFLSVLPADATEPNALIYLAYAGAVVLAIGLVILGVGLLRNLDNQAAKSDDIQIKPLARNG